MFDVEEQHVGPVLLEHAAALDAVGSLGDHIQFRP